MGSFQLMKKVLIIPGQGFELLESKALLMELFLSLVALLSESSHLVSSWRRGKSLIKFPLIDFISKASKVQNSCGYDLPPRSPLPYAFC